jgi:phosphohistidine phosphatase
VKALSLLRHAKAEKSGGPQATDRDRPLAGRWRKDAARVGGELGRRGFLPDAVYCSPALRARETIEIIAPLLGFDARRVRFEEGLYLAPGALVDFIRGLDAGLERVLICGHNPSLGMTGAYFTEDMDRFPPCAFLQILFAASSWEQAARSRVQASELLFPETLRD